MGAVFDLDAFIDRQKIGRLHVRVIGLCFLVMLSDGYDLQAAAYAAPGLVHDWHVTGADLAPLFSASLFGMLFGGPLLAFVGDRFGRRQAIALGSLIYGVFSLAAGWWAGSLNELVLLRFLTGIGLGGLPGNCVALTAEYAPKRVRATMVVLMYLGITIGSVLPAGAVALLGGDAGWRTLFEIGGLAPIAFSLVAWLALPESAKFLALRPGNTAKIARLLRRLEPGFTLAPDARVIIPVLAGPPTRFKGALLFSRGLAAITPMIWVLFAFSLTANFFLHSWMPLLLRQDGFSAGSAALVTSLYDIGGIFGALTISRLLDRRGMVALALYFLCAVPVIASIGIPGLPSVLLAAAVFFSGFGIVGIQLGMNAAVGVIYPTEIRATAAGYAMAAGRVGGIGGLLLGGVLLGMHLTLFELFLAPAVPMAAGAAICFVLTQLCRRRFGGDRLAEAASIVPAPPPAYGVATSVPMPRPATR